MADFVAAIDQGTTSTRLMIFDHEARVVGRHQLEHEQVLPRAGWVEHDPVEIRERTSAVIQIALRHAGLTASDLAAVGITNQRETTFVWNRRTGQPYANAIVWQDTRNAQQVRDLDSGPGGRLVRDRTGLVPATYFSAGKLRWLLDNVDGLRRDAERGDALFGTSDSWVLWNLTGGPDGGVHSTDVTNASRTMLMNLDTLDWDDELLELFGVPSGHAADDCLVVRDRGLRHDVGLGSVRWRGAGDRGAGRPAGSHGGPALLQRRRREMHVRHGQFPARQHRQQAHRVAPSACSRRSATASATSRRPTPSKDRSP